MEELSVCLNFLLLRNCWRFGMLSCIFMVKWPCVCLLLQMGTTKDLLLGGDPKSLF
jgi:hypothetical protein